MIAERIGVVAITQIVAEPAKAFRASALGCSQ